MTEGAPKVKKVNENIPEVSIEHSQKRGELENLIAQLSSIEKKESMGIKEKLDVALDKLQEIIAGLPVESHEHIVAEHTLHSVEEALGNLGKDGAPSGTYAIPVEEYTGNPQEPYTQYEGVPVDELIAILKNAAKELNKDFPTKEALAELKKKAEDLNEHYIRTVEVTEKANLYSAWEKAMKEYREMEEKLDIGPSEKVRELTGLADDLYKASQSYFEAHYDVAHGKDESAWTEEERNRQDLRTRLEAKLISLDYRATGSEEEDYKAAMEVLKQRRELQLTEEVNPELSPEPNPAEIPAESPENPAPTPVPVSPASTEGRKAERIVIVDAQAQVELMARKRGTELLNEKLNQRNWLKKKWTHMWEQGYRQQLISEERKEILGQENRPGFIRRGLFGARSFEATGEKNLFAGTGEESQNSEELKSLATRFSEDLHRESEGEEKRQLEDPEFNTKINDLIYEFASGAMPETDFDVKKDELIGQISEKYPDIFAQGGLTADNLLEAARDFRNIYAHGNGLARVDVNLDVDLGLAKQAIKTEANLNWVDKVVGSTQKYMGPAISPEAVGFGVSIVSYFSRKPLYWLGGAAGLGGLMGAMRRNVEQKKDLEMHRVERAMGIQTESGAPRREAAEKFVYEMRSSAEIVTEVRQLSTDFNAHPDATTAEALTNALADAEARHSLSEERQKDLISFSGETVLERGRLDFMRTLAEAKISLSKNGFESDISRTDAYQSSLTSLGSDMNKIDRSEKFHRWTENGKAAITGAIGGLLVGGLVQEGLAFAGDHVDVLHWLRPGGKATSVENLYHHLKGDSPTVPTGAGMQEALGSLTSTGVINIDGTTELIPDRTNGLMDLVDKTDHSRILAQVSIDEAGHVTPVPGSYDPHLINFSESKVGGGALPLDEWVSSMKDKFGSNVTSDTWHTGGYLENDTPLPKAEFNELKLFMSYDANGDLTIDASKLQEYVENASGEQTQGSAHGSTVLDVAGEFAKGTIKIGLAPDAAHPTSVLELTYNPESHTFVAPNGTPITDFFESDAKGHPVLKGNGVLGIVHQLDIRPDGSKDVEWVNAIRGNGDAIATGEKNHLVTEIGRRNPLTWWGPWIWSFGRKPLEERTKSDNESNGGLIDAEGKYADFKPEFFEPIIKKGDEGIEGKKITKTSLDTRGQKIESLDSKDWEGEYPEKFPLTNEKEMAEFLVAQGDFYATQKDQDKYRSLQPEEKVGFLEECIKRDREFFELANGEKLLREDIQDFVDVVLSQTDEVFNQYSEKDRSKLPAKERIHVVGTIEYQAQLELSHGDSLGTCFSRSGEIFVNFDLIKDAVSKNGPVATDVLIAQLKRTIAHEIVHDSVANNYWMFQTEEVNPAVVQRRTGLLFRGYRDKSGNTSEKLIIERGRALNEAVTEALAENIKDAVYSKEKGPVPQNIIEPYSAERNVLSMLMEKFDIPFEVFAKAAINRKALRQLAEKLNGISTIEQTDINKPTKSKATRPQFMPLLLSIMDSECNHKSFDYKTTKKLISGEKGIVITKEMKKSFAPSLLENGMIRGDIIAQYNLIDEEEAKKIPMAA